MKSPKNDKVKSETTFYLLLMVGAVLCAAIPNTEPAVGFKAFVLIIAICRLLFNLDEMRKRK